MELHLVIYNDDGEKLSSCALVQTKNIGFKQLWKLIIKVW